MKFKYELALILFVLFNTITLLLWNFDLTSFSRVIASNVVVIGCLLLPE